ncbi:MAG: MopE-related protein, partial [Myxococcota bacterium]
MRTLTLILALVACAGDDAETDTGSPWTDLTDSTDDTDTDTDTDTDCEEVEVFDDSDGDGWGDPETLTMACEPDEDQVLRGEDCDDTEGTTNPDADEVCGDGVDNNCDGGAPSCRLQGELQIGDHASIHTDSESGEGFGTSVAIVPDVDGDGRADLLIGRPGDNRYRPGNGWVGLYTGVGRDVSSMTPVITFRRRRDNENLGAGVLGLHLDGNTQTDLVLAAPRARRGSVLDVGAVHVIYDVKAGAEIELESNPGALFTGSDNKDQAGATLAAPGDVDGDGVIDLAISAVQPTGDKPGRVYLVNGSGGRLEDVAQTELVGPATHNRMGDILAAAGDTDGDGLGEVVVGAASRSAPTVTLWWYADPAEGVVQTAGASASLDGGTLMTLQAGVVDGAGDVNDDGYDDLWVGAPAFADSGDKEGAVYLFHGPITAGWALDDADAVVSGTSKNEHLGSTVTGG